MVAARKLEYDYSMDSAVQIKKDHKRKAKRKRLPESVLVLILACICVGLCLFYLGQKVKTMHLSIEINQLEQKLENLYEENAHLVLELESVQRLTHLETIARGQLGMVDPENASMLVMSMPDEDTYLHAKGWIADNDQPKTGLFVVVADWINQWLPIGGVEAGRIGR